MHGDHEGFIITCSTASPHTSMVGGVRSRFCTKTCTACGVPSEFSLSVTR